MTWGKKETQELIFICVVLGAVFTPLFLLGWIVAGGMHREVDCSIGYTKRQIFGNDVCRPIVEPTREHCKQGYVELWNDLSSTRYCAPGYEL